MPQKSIFDLFGEKSPARMVTVKVNPCQKLLESVSECKELNASVFLHILSTQDINNVIKYFPFTDIYL